MMTFAEWDSQHRHAEAEVVWNAAQMAVWDEEPTRLLPTWKTWNPVHRTAESVWNAAQERMTHC